MVHGILQARILEWVAISFSQGSNPGLLNCRQILYQLSHQGSPLTSALWESSVPLSLLLSIIYQNCIGAPPCFPFGVEIGIDAFGELISRGFEFASIAFPRPHFC